MKEIIILALMFICSFSHAAEWFQPNRIDTVDKKEGSVTINGEGFYQVMHLISLSNETANEATLDKGCFVLFDEAGNELSSSGAEIKLFEKYGQGENKTGQIFFRSKKKAVYDMPFIKWSATDCGITEIKKP